MSIIHTYIDELKPSQQFPSNCPMFLQLLPLLSTLIKPKSQLMSIYRCQRGEALLCRSMLFLVWQILCESCNFQSQWNHLVDRCQASKTDVSNSGLPHVYWTTNESLIRKMNLRCTCICTEIPCLLPPENLLPPHWSQIWIYIFQQVFEAFGDSHHQLRFCLL